jgi:hypothetical protein
MATPTPQASGKVTVDVEVLERLASALESMGTAFVVDELSEARAVALVARLAAERGVGAAASTSTSTGTEEQRRVSRDYEVLRGLLGRAGAARSLRMRRQQDNRLVIDDEPPPSAATVRVATAGGTRLDIPLPAPPRRGAPLPLGAAAPGQRLVRIELVDAGGALVAFGPALAPVDTTT